MCTGVSGKLSVSASEVDWRDTDGDSAVLLVEGMTQGPGSQDGLLQSGVDHPCCVMSAALQCALTLCFALGTDS